MTDVPWRGRAFGLTIEADEPIPGVVSDIGSSTRHTWWERGAEHWAPAEVRALVDKRHPNGELFMRVDHDSELGYRIEAPGYGIHVVATDGSRIASDIPADGTRTWQRLFFAQVLPLAAAAAGLDLLHAGAVAYRGRIFGFVAASGVGKTSVVTHLVADGADFVTDDVLALEVVDSSVKAHSGPAALSLDPTELESLRLRGRDRVATAGPWATIDGKAQIDVPSASSASTLGGLFFLERSETCTFALRRTSVGLGPRILGAAFLPYVKSRARISTHLDVSAAIAGAVPTYTVTIPAGAKASETAARIREAGADEELWSA